MCMRGKPSCRNADSDIHRIGKGRGRWHFRNESERTGDVNRDARSRSYFCQQFETTNIERCAMYTVERRHTAVDRESNRPEPSGAINLQTMVRSSLGQNSLSGTKRAFLQLTIHEMLYLVRC
jgi:hypothetical protein